MKNEHVMVRLTGEEKKMVTSLQEDYAINVSQYVRNQLGGLYDKMNGLVIDEESITTHLPLDFVAKEYLKELRMAHFNPKTLIDIVVSDEDVLFLIEEKIKEIYLGFKDGEIEPVDGGFKRIKSEKG